MNCPRVRFVTHTDLKTPNGDSYLETAAQRLLKADTEPLARFLADVKAVPDGKAIKITCAFGNYTPDQWRPMTFITQSILDQFEQAAREFYSKAHHDKTLGAFQRQVIKGFKLPDPDKDPQSYWLVGDRFNPRLVIWWGCEKLEANKSLDSLPLVDDPEFYKDAKETIVAKLRARLITWPDILRENLDLIVARRDPIGKMLARPVYNKQHDRVIALTPLFLPETNLPITQFRPLKKIASGQIKAFEEAALAYYAKAHTDEDTLKQFPEVTDYERELRRSFRLPDVDLPSAKPGNVPDDMADFASSLAQPAGKKDAKAKAKQEGPTPSYWLLGKPAKLMIMINDGELKERCFCLVADEALNLPPEAAKPAADVEDLAGPRAPLTIAEKLRKRVRNPMVILSMVGGVLAFAALLAFVFLNYIYVPLGKGTAVVTDDRNLDLYYDRDVILVTFPKAIQTNSIVRAGIMDKTPTFMLEDDKGAPVEIKEIQPRPSNDKQIVLLLDKANAVPDDAKYKLVVNGLRPKFGRPLAKKDSQIDVDALDKRVPEVERVEAAPDSLKKIWVIFSKPMNEDVSGTGHYTIKDVTIDKAGLKLKSPKVAILSATTDFVISNQYKIHIEGVHDMAHANNALAATNVPFTYRDMPPMFDDPGVTATFDQLTIRAVFTQEVDAQTATNLDSYNLFLMPNSPASGGAAAPPMIDSGTNRLTLYHVGLEKPARNAVMIGLTNSHMLANRSYALTFTGLKNVRGNPGADTNIFPFLGRVDTTGPVFKERQLAPDNQSVKIVFNKPIQGEATRDKRFFSLKQVSVQSSDTSQGGWQESHIDLLPSQEDADSVRVRFSPPLASQYRYQLSWSNMQDRVENMGLPELTGLVPQSIVDKFQVSSEATLVDEQNRVIGVEIKIYYHAPLEDSSFNPENFHVKLGDKEAPPGMKAEKVHNDKPKDLYRIDVKLTWPQELPKDAIHVIWKVTPESEPPTELDTTINLKAESSNSNKAP